MCNASLPVPGCSRGEPAPAHAYLAHRAELWGDVPAELASFLTSSEYQSRPLIHLQEWEDSWAGSDSLENLSGKELLALQVFWFQFLK